MLPKVSLQSTTSKPAIGFLTVGDELDTVFGADINDNMSQVAMGGPQKIVRIYDTSTGDVAFELKKHTDWVYCVEYSPDGVLVASGDRSGGLHVWEADTGRLYMDLIGHKDAVRAVSWRGDSNVLVSASEDGTVKIWEMVGRQATQELQCTRRRRHERDDGQRRTHRHQWKRWHRQALEK